MAQKIVAWDGQALREALRRGQSPRSIVSALGLRQRADPLRPSGDGARGGEELSERRHPPAGVGTGPPSQSPAAPERTSTQRVEKDPGPLETRRCWQSQRLDWLADPKKWESLRSVGVVESVRQVGTEAPTVERRYDLSSPSRP